MEITRRGLLELGAALAAAWRSPLRAQETSPSPRRPTVVASGNGLRGVAKAYAMIHEQGADPLDAAIAGVNIQELDPEDSSVGLGGLPNEEGVVQLDAACIHGPSRRAGAVGALEGFATPSLVAQQVMLRTDHVLLVGEGARRFARDLGFEEQELLTAESRRRWLAWRARRGPRDNWLEEARDHDPGGTDGTIHMGAVDAAGAVGCVTTTSGLAWKVPGRVGDSPILGAGLYCDNQVGAAGSTGRGEANMKACGAFLVVEEMRRGRAPEDACITALERVVATTEARLLDAAGRPGFHLSYYAVAKDGRWGGASLYPRQEGGPFHMAVADAAGARLEPLRPLFPEPYER